jgi:indolepyruvate ferredoxin oxidoreductase alpha subunit
MEKLLLLGDEAIAQGAIDGGMSGIYAYPGTPSTEIMEFVQGSQIAEDLNINRVWSANEKTAMESALGMSYAGKRSMVCFKHVGLNVAADAFVNASITGVNGGVIVVSADDPSMHSSQNEQDSRFYAKFAMIPILEPSNQQEAYEMAYNAFELSEKLNVPVMIRITTRLAHSRAGVQRSAVKKQNTLKLPSDPRQFVLLPAIARKNYKKLLGMQPAMDDESEKSIFNTLYEGKDKKIGIIAAGLSYNYLMENYPDGTNPHPTLKICQYPLPHKQVAQLYNQCDSLLILEDGAPIIEEMIKGFLNLGKPIKGRLDGTLPRDGELNPNIVAKALGMTIPEGQCIPDVVKNRPPSLCQGCGHIDVFTDLNEVLNSYGTGRVFSDIGCYTLAALPPFNSVNSCVDMGASITMAIGAADAGLVPAVSVIGDSTFTHSGMTGLLDAVNKNSPITVIISDNSTTGMTGGQTSAATGRIFEICQGIGVHPDHLKIITPLKKNHEENVRIIREELEYKGLSVIIPQRECIQTFARRKKAEKSESN